MMNLFLQLDSKTDFHNYSRQTDKYIGIWMNEYRHINRKPEMSWKKNAYTGNTQWEGDACA